MRWLMITLPMVAALGCQISPVVSEPAEQSSRYDDCRRAARDYCRDVVGVDETDRKRCVSEAAFECMTGKSD